MINAKYIFEWMIVVNISVEYSINPNKYNDMFLKRLNNFFVQCINSQHTLELWMYIKVLKNL